MYLKVVCRKIKENKLPHKTNELAVYLGNTDALVKKVPLFFNLLSDDEKVRANRFMHESDYNCYVSAHALLRIELSRHLGIDAKSIVFNKTDHGKPFTEGVDLPFNLSRSKNLFAFVIGQSNQSLGVDIEQVKFDFDFVDISRNYFSTGEQQLVFSCNSLNDQYHTFFEIWTRKEALLKAIGIGLNTILSKVPVLEGENNLTIDEAITPLSTYKISTFDHDRAMISIASTGDFTPVFQEL